METTLPSFFWFKKALSDLIINSVIIFRHYGSFRYQSTGLGNTRITLGNAKDCPPVALQRAAPTPDQSQPSDLYASCGEEDMRNAYYIDHTTSSEQQADANEIDATQEV